MIRGLYTAASGMFSLERKQETLANNIANIETPGYKQDDTQLRAFPKLLISRIQDYSGAPQIPGQPVPIGELTNGVYAQERVPNFSEGTLVETDQPLDLAINDQDIPSQNVNGRQVKPAAFFAVQMPNGSVGYTRDGKFDLDSNGNLVTADGYRVLGADHQPIKITDSISKDNFHINSDGQLLVNTNNPTQTKIAGQIGIAVVQNPLQLQRMGGNVFSSSSPVPFIQDAGQSNPGVSIQQGFIEQSNVDAGQTMSDMMMTVRGYEANQKVISAYDQSLQQLDTVGKMD
ncbi:flagellar hook-basal body protein [Bacillus sp. BRMEA1]|uniref:flagellar hook-basal body protein n=1 Tax=Neobacillus endophyticus TaxID=2738405 RepID=UPI001565304A|nr:flagellar hook-basal body protein [Neobacillus endophyticus]NRD79377.1 flagellar hook-basal body protein [Neobacillus endophyticus]